MRSLAITFALSIPIAGVCFYLAITIAGVCISKHDAEAKVTQPQAKVGALDYAARARISEAWSTVDGYVCARYDSDGGLLACSDGGQAPDCAKHREWWQTHCCPGCDGGCP